MKSQLAALVTVFAPLAVAQHEAQSPPSSLHIKLKYPRDKERAIAKVDSGVSGEITLEHLARHINERRHPGFRQFLATKIGSEIFQGTVMASWARHLVMKSQLAALLAVLAPLAVAQPEAESRPSSSYIQLQYPRDKERAIAKVDGGEITLEDLARHIEERHRPGFREFLATRAGNLYFQTPVMVTWARQYADIVALHSEARSRNLDLQQAEVSLAASLKTGFEDWLQEFAEQRDREGNPLPLTQDRVNRLLARYQRDNGLETELKGWLDFLVRDDATIREVRDYYSDQAKIFGGRINMAHILINTRDPLTLILLEGEAKERADKKLANARFRLRDDGSNFEEVARLLSDDRITAKRGGAFHNVTRFDTRLSAILCRTAWQLRDGDVSEPVQTRYGTHIVKRISFQMNTFTLFTEQIVPKVRTIMRQHRQEDLLFELRKRRRVELLY